MHEKDFLYYSWNNNSNVQRENDPTQPKKKNMKDFFPRKRGREKNDNVNGLICLQEEYSLINLCQQPQFVSCSFFSLSSLKPKFFFGGKWTIFLHFLCLQWSFFSLSLFQKSFIFHVLLDKLRKCSELEAVIPWNAYHCAIVMVQLSS